MRKSFQGFGAAILYALAYSAITMIANFICLLVAAAFFVFRSPDLFSGESAQLVTILEQWLASNAALPLLFSNLVAVLSVWLFFVIRKKKLFREIKLKKISGANLLAAIVFGASFSIVLTVGINLIPFSPEMLESLQANTAALPSENTLLNLITIVLVGPIAEEIFFRGLIYTRLKAGMHPILAAVISSVLFGIGHGGFIWFFSAFLGGLVMVWIFETTKSLYASLAVHMTNNAVAQLTQQINAFPTWLVVICIVLLVGAIFYLKLQNEIPPQAAQPTQPNAG